jgi:hypothetical protein
VPDVPTSDDYIYHSFEIQIQDEGQGLHATGAAYDAEAPRGKVKDFAAEGYAGLQNHDSLSPVYFKDIFMKEL